MSTASKKETKVNTETTQAESTATAAPAAPALNIEAMSLAELFEMHTKLTAIYESKKKEGLASICDSFIESLTANGFTKEDAFEYFGITNATATRKDAGSKSNFPRELWGRSFKNPANGEIFTKSATGKGRVENWLAALVEAGNKYEDYLVP